MLIGKASVKNLSGPISIAKYAGQSANMGLVPFINFMASISLGFRRIEFIANYPYLMADISYFSVLKPLKAVPSQKRYRFFSSRLVWRYCCY